jgi:hypothetical protein
MLFAFAAALCFISHPMTANEVETNVLVGNKVEVNAEINAYENILAGSPIQGTIMVTHDAKNLVDSNSFTLGHQPLNVQLVKTVSMSSYSNLVVSIYAFQLEGMKAGSYTLPPIKVKVGGQSYQAPPLSLEVSEGK